MVQAFAPNGANDPFDIGSLPRSARCRQNFVNPHVCDLLAEFLPEDGVAIAQQVARNLLKRKRFSQLLSGPFRRWMGGHIEMENAPAVVG
jgi:hypothetical protein